MCIRYRRTTDLGLRSEWNHHAVLENINLHFAAGEKICLSGSNGSGKTSLLRILSAGVLPTQGTVSFDGQPLTSLDLPHVRSMIGTYLSDENVFIGTVMENIVVGRKWITETDVMEAAKTTGLFNHLATLPSGLLTQIQAEGGRLPRSLVTRIALTRGIVGKPRMLLLDDSMLDWEKTEREQLLGWITDSARPWTLVIVSNDPWVHGRCDQVIHMHNGQIKTS